MRSIVQCFSVALALGFLIGVSIGAEGRPRLSTVEVLRIADAHARSALRRDLNGFRRSPPRYSEKNKVWTVVYLNTAATAPST